MFDFLLGSANGDDIVWVESEGNQSCRMEKSMIIVETIYDNPWAMYWWLMVLSYQKMQYG